MRKIKPASIPLTIVVAIVAALLAIDGGAATSVGAKTRSSAKLVRFNSCKQLNSYASHHPRVLRSMGGYVYAMEDMPATGAPVPGGTGGGTDTTTPAPTSPTTAPTSQQGTNVQEAGVDEPDIVKASGTRILAIAKGKLYAIDASAAEPKVVDSLELPGGNGVTYDNAELLVAGDTALAIARPSVYAYGEPIALDYIGPTSSRTILSQIDISDPAAMKVTKTMSIEGDYVSARLTGSTARVVISATPQYPAAPEPPNGGFVPPNSGVNPPETALRKGGANNFGPNWMPTAVFRDKLSGERSAHPITKCSAVEHPSDFSGLGTLNVLTIDLKQGLPAVDSDAVTTGGDTIYASTDNLYVATEHWWDPYGGPNVGTAAAGVSTEIHKFDISDPHATEYTASGEVPGYMLSQWSMSEQDGVLRVASTTQPPWRPEGQSEKSQSYVTTLGERDGQLAKLGQLGGLGSNQQIYAVRFIGNTGYVVTFRQVDPLYTIDLTDPTAPKVLGELEIPGYSSYLHPVGDGLLLGIGQSATPEGRLLGLQLQLFDVHDPAHPVRIDQQLVAPHAYSEAENDHHAFLYYRADGASDGLVVIPADWYENNTARQEFSGAIGYRVGPTGIEEVGRISHDADASKAPIIRRSVVLGGRLYTLSDEAVQAGDLGTLASLGQAQLP